MVDSTLKMVSFFLRLQSPLHPMPCLGTRHAASRHPCQKSFAQVGGMADVVTALSRAVQEAGHNVKVILPKYDIINYAEVGCCCRQDHVQPRPAPLLPATPSVHLDRSEHCWWQTCSKIYSGVLLHVYCHW